MDEHEDDLESEVHENAEREADTFPDTADELDEVINGDDGDEPNLDDDAAEL